MFSDYKTISQIFSKIMRFLGITRTVTRLRCATPGQADENTPLCPAGYAGQADWHTGKKNFHKLNKIKLDFHIIDIII
jgi:hypothetical protein